VQGDAATTYLVNIAFRVCSPGIFPIIHQNQLANNNPGVNMSLRKQPLFWAAFFLLLLSRTLKKFNEEV
jgi:hypothetical protein